MTAPILAGLVSLGLGCVAALEMSTVDSSAVPNRAILLGGRIKSLEINETSAGNPCAVASYYRANFVFKLLAMNILFPKSKI